MTVGRRASLLRACGLARRDSAPTACEFVLSISAILTLGFLLGMRHATDADHVVAVSTIVCRQRTLRAAVPIGILWGIGHTVTILVIGGTIIFFGMVIPPRLGLMMANDGMWNGQQVVPKEVLLEATTVSPGSEYLRFKSGAGYGNQVWLLPSKGRMFALWGRYGQVVFVDPASRLVMVQTAVEMQTSDESASPKALALWQALLTLTSETKP